MERAKSDGEFLITGDCRSSSHEIF